MDGNIAKDLEHTDAGKSRATWGDYLALARLDHSTKHIFILPGVVLAYLLREAVAKPPGVDIFLGLLAAVSIASANYVINEYLDREFDRHHPDSRTDFSPGGQSYYVLPGMCVCTAGDCLQRSPASDQG
jgi:4-hydroxybenzoate polyprenyltransferase